jgi:hypothetical protein
VEEEDVPKTNENPVEAQAPAKQRSWKRWLFVGGGLLIALPVLVLVIWSVIALNWSYSEGDRAGYVQKFSKKGWICKTWEGELSMINIPGAAPERFEFTVRDDNVANQITSNMGNRVSLRYEEHPGVPTSCFGETRYYVTGVRPVGAP